MIIGRIQQDGNAYFVTRSPEDLARYGLAVGDTIAFTPRRVDPAGTPRLSPEDEAAVATFRNNPGFRRALDYLAAHYLCRPPRPAPPTSPRRSSASPPRSRTQASRSVPSSSPPSAV